MIVGATPETDFQIMRVAESLYQKFDLKRVFYSAFVHVNEDKALPAAGEQGPPLFAGASSLSGRLAFAVLWISGGRTVR